MMIGKNEMTTAMTTRVIIPVPNQITKIGAKASFGTLWSITRSGIRMRCRTRDCTMRMARISALAVPMASPLTAPVPVVTACLPSRCACFKNSAQIAVGAGKSQFGTLNAIVISCHRTTRPTTAAIEAKLRRSASRMPVIRFPGGSVTAATAQQIRSYPACATAEDAAADCR